MVSLKELRYLLDIDDATALEVVVDNARGRAKQARVGQSSRPFCRRFSDPQPRRDTAPQPFIKHCRWDSSPNLSGLDVMMKVKSLRQPPTPNMTTQIALSHSLNRRALESNDREGQPLKRPMRRKSDDRNSMAAILDTLVAELELSDDDLLLTDE